MPANNAKGIDRRAERAQGLRAKRLGRRGRPVTLEAQQTELQRRLRKMVRTSKSRALLDEVFAQGLSARETVSVAMAFLLRVQEAGADTRPCELCQGQTHRVVRLEAEDDDGKPPDPFVVECRRCRGAGTKGLALEHALGLEAKAVDLLRKSVEVAELLEESEVPGQVQVDVAHPKILVAYLQAVLRMVAGPERHKVEALLQLAEDLGLSQLSLDVPEDTGDEIVVS